MSEDEQDVEYVIDEIVGHMNKKKVIEQGSLLAYNEKELEDSKCEYAFRVRWVGFDGEDTWQTYESFDDKKLPKNYGRLRGIELFPRTERELSTEEIQRRVNEIEEKARMRLSSGSSPSPTPSMRNVYYNLNDPPHTDGEEEEESDDGDTTLRENDKKNMTRASSKDKDEVVVLSSDNEDDGEVKKSAEGRKNQMKSKKDARRMENELMGVEINRMSDASDSSSVIKQANVAGLKIRMSSEEKREKKRISEGRSPTNSNDGDKRVKSKPTERKEDEFTLHTSKKRQREEEEKRKEEERKKAEQKKKRRSDQRRRTPVESSEESDEDSDAMERKKRRRNKKHSNEDDSEPEEKKSKGERGDSKQRKAQNEMDMKGIGRVHLGEESSRRRTKDSKDRESDEAEMTLVRRKRTSNESVKETQKEGRTRKSDESREKARRSTEKRAPMGKRSRSPVVKVERKESSDESDDSEASADTVDSDEEGWEFEKIITHVTVKDVKTGRDIEEKETLNWKKINKSQLPMIFRVSFSHPKGYLKKNWLMIEELDDLPALNKYCSTSKLVLPKGYPSMMRKKEKVKDDLYDSE